MCNETICTINSLKHSDKEWSKFINKFSRAVTKNIKGKSSIVFVFIGTDRSTGDALGPLTGTFVKESTSKYDFVYCYGDIHDPVHAKNLEEKLSYIQNKHGETSLIIGVDACLGKLDRVGFINFNKKPLNPGAGINKDLPGVGEMCITGVVNIGGFMESIVLQNTRLSVVWNMAISINHAISRACKNIHKRKWILKTTD